MRLITGLCASESALCTKGRSRSRSLRSRDVKAALSQYPIRGEAGGNFCLLGRAEHQSVMEASLETPIVSILKGFNGSIEF